MNLTRTFSLEQEAERRKRGPGSLACARVRDDRVGAVERNSLPDACRVGTPSQARERCAFPPHAVRRWMQQRELLQTEALFFDAA